MGVEVGEQGMLVAIVHSEASEKIFFISMKYSLKGHRRYAWGISLLTEMPQLVHKVIGDVVNQEHVESLRGAYHLVLEWEVGVGLVC